MNEHFDSLRLADGRRLAWRCYGRAGGRPLMFFHGFPGCRLQAALVHETAAAAGVELIAVERPGFGRSDFAPGRTVLSWADDVAQLADHLGLARFGVVGVSCGGAYALACARQLAARLDYVGLVAGMGPMDLPPIRVGQLPLLRLLFAAARLHPGLAAPLLLPDALMFRRAPERALSALSSMLTAPDQRLLTSDATVRSQFAASLAEAYTGGLRGALHEAHLIARPRGFELADITLPVHVYQGGADRHVPPAMGRHLATTLPAGRLRIYPEEGHLSILVHRFGDCLSDHHAAVEVPSTAET